MVFLWNQFMRNILKIAHIILLLMACHVQSQMLKKPNSVAHFAPVFTQGLIIQDNIVWESSGLYGKSLLTQWDLRTGEVLKQKKIDKKYFAEGLTELNDKLYMLTWQAGIAFEIDKGSLETLKKHRYTGQGWGLTTDGQHLIMSNGSDVIQYINPDNFKTEKSIQVHTGQSPIRHLNELEWINGKIWANVYQTDYIIVINPETGEVEEEFYLPNLLSGKKPGVLNGIAYDPVQHKIWVTGKNWPSLFELSVPFEKKP